MINLLVCNHYINDLNSLYVEQKLLFVLYFVFYVGLKIINDFIGYGSF
jgi:hypothetical protein